MTLRLIQPLAPELEAAWQAYLGASAVAQGLSSVQQLSLDGPLTKEECARAFLRGAEAELRRLATIEAQG